MSRNLKLGIFGFGVVGQGLYHVLEETKGIKAEILKICVKNKQKKRPLPMEYFTYKKEDILENPEVDVVLELIDDPKAAYEIVTAALKKGKAVVTANKKMVADHMTELYELQKEYNAPLLYEGACCASIPIIRNLEEYYDNDLLSAVEGIFNGSTNYILTKVFSEQKSFGEALTEAQELGYAETDPSLDIEGFDAKYKLCIILTHAFGLFVNPDDIFNYGIQNISEFDIKIARERGYKIKLVAKSRKIDDKVIAMVMPQFVSDKSELYKVEREFNGVIVEGAFSEHQFFIGKGAGGYPTGSAVLSDISALTYNYMYEYKKTKQVADLELSSDYEIIIYLRFDNQSIINKDDFNLILEEYKALENHYVIGKINFSKLVGSKWLSNPNINIILMENSNENHG
ncbi:MAG: homoserine dehydrogenase [Cyclobacteriaceae bacterium]|nr:homoserine dehydrogenase [Cyclobacteriaceae bacterium]MCK5702616.1 homoserine dehydrogenase [Cyclobacteriaceae bacterium]